MAPSECVRIHPTDVYTTNDAYDNEYFFLQISLETLYYGYGAFWDLRAFRILLFIITLCNRAVKTLTFFVPKYNKIFEKT